MDEINKEDINGDKSNNYVISIKNFEGPLDLLWDLIKRAKIDITDISISQITEQYIKYLKLMEKMNVRIASEFVLMASDLLYYKSKALIPGEEIEDEYFVPPLPPDLVQKLIEYKKFQLVSFKLKDCYDTQSNVFTRTNIVKEIDGEEYIGVTIFDLLNAFARVLNRTEKVEHEELVFDEILVSDRIDLINSLLLEKEEIFFDDVFSSRPSKMEIVTTFMAILELAKYSKVKLFQHKIFGDIRILRA